MMLISTVPHEKTNRPIIRRIPKADLHLIIDEINQRINAVVNTSDKLITAGWIPGTDWSGTVWQPIYIASRKDFNLAGMVFGALVFEVVMNRPENWSFGKYQVDGRDISSMTYFKI